MTWIPTCNSDEVYIKDPQLRDYELWRGMDYYVDPTSVKVLELGTQLYPFKNIALVFIEILNFHSHSDRNINIYLKENTTHYMTQTRNYIVNITQVNFDSYSDVLEEPGRAQIYGIDYDFPIFSPETVTNIIVDDTLNLEENLNIPGLTENEQNQREAKDSVIYLIRSNLKMNNINVYRNPDTDVNKPTLFIKPLYLQDKSVTFTNVDFRVTGIIMETIDPMSLYAQNLYVDFYASMGGFLLLSHWNYPEANKTGVINVSGMVMEYSRDRIVGLKMGMVFHNGGNDYTINNSSFTTYSILQYDRWMTTKYLNPNCFPDDDVVQKVSWTNNYWTLPYSAVGDRLLCMFCTWSTNYYRKVVLTYSNNTHEHFADTPYSVVLISTTPLTDIVMQNNYFHNMSALYGIIQAGVASNSVLVENVLYTNSETVDTFNIQTADSNQITMRNITHKNITVSASKTGSFIEATLNNDGNFTAEDIFFEDWNFKFQKSLYASGSIDQYVLSNIHYTNVLIESGTSAIDIATFKFIHLANLFFNGIFNLEDNSEDNQMVNVGHIDLSSFKGALIEDVDITNAQIDFIQIKQIVGELLNDEVLFTLRKINYHDCFIEKVADLIKFENLESDQNITFIIEDSMFSNITFSKSGNLIKFSHQLSNQAILRNIVMNNITSGRIYLDSSNKQNEVPTKVLFQNLTLSDINSNFISAISTFGQSELVIEESSFTGVSWLEEGGIIYAGNSKTIVTIRKSNFTENASIQGGIFYVERESVIEVYDSIIHSNFAVISGVIQASNNGYFKFFNTTVNNNYAISSSVSQIFDVAESSVISNSNITSNIVLNSSVVSDEINLDWDFLWFLPTNFKQYLLDNRRVYDIASVNINFQLVYSSIALNENSMISNTENIIDSYISTVLISNLTLKDILLKGGYVLKFTSTTIEINDTEIINISNEIVNPVISVTLGSNFSSNGITFNNSTVSLIDVVTSYASFSRLMSSNINPQTSFIRIFESLDFSIRNSNLFDIETGANSPILIDKSIISEIANLTTNTLIEVKSWTVDQISQLYVRDSTRNFIIEDSNVTQISQSEFINNGGDAITFGGAILVKDSNVSITDSIFLNNSAQEGGAISFLWSGSNQWSLNIIDVNFNENSASVSGGAIKYDSLRPHMDNNSFINNSAVYGPNIGSYPVRIKIKGTNTDQIILNNVGSGVDEDLNIEMALYDYDNQIFNLESTSTIEITPILSETLILGQTAANLKEGVAKFETTQFIAEQGFSNIHYKLDCEAIDLETVRREFGSNYNLKDIIVNFRFCKPGESITDNTWSACSPGSYSLEWNSTKWETWVDNANWLGETQISLDEGYWRYSQNSTVAVECPNPDAWKGGYSSDDNNPSPCAPGYKGFLWSNWDIVDGEKYERFAEFEWSKCPDPALNIIRVLGLGLLVVGFIAVLIIVNIRKMKESQTSVLMRMMTNYLQLTTVTLSFNMRFPDNLKEIFTPMQRIGSSSGTLLSFDWFQSQTELKLFAPSSPFLKAFLTSLLPLIMLMFISIIFGILKGLFPQKFKNFKRNVIVSIITVLFLMYPTLTNTAFEMFQCIGIPDEGLRRVKIDSEIEWYSTEHILWWLYVATPMIIVWVIGCPLAAFIVLYKNRNRLYNEEFQKYFIVLYQGFDDRRYYWEIVNTLRKIVVVIINVFLANYNIFYKGAWAIIVLLIMSRIQIYLKPFKLETNNEWELMSYTGKFSLGNLLIYLASTLTLFWGLMYAADVSRVGFVDFFAFVCIIIINIYFILFWVYLMCLNYSNYTYVMRILNILKTILRRKENISNKNELCVTKVKTRMRIPNKKKKVNF